MMKERLLSALVRFREHLIDDGQDGDSVMILDEAMDWIKASSELSPSPPDAVEVRIAVAVDTLACGRTIVEAVGIDDFDDDATAMERLTDRIQSSTASKAIVVGHIPRRVIPCVSGVVEEVKNA